MEAILFVHSTGSGPLLWSTVPEELGPRRKLHPANLGYPPNPLLERGVELNASKEDARHLLETLPSDVDRVHLVAHSYGALVSLHLAEMIGSRVASMFFYEPVIFGLVEGKYDFEPAAIAEFEAFKQDEWFLTDVERGGREQWLERFIDYWNRPGSWSKMPEGLREATRAVGWKMFQEVRSCFMDHTAFDMSRWTMPVTIVRGDRSPPASKDMAKALTGMLPNAQLIDVERTGHMAPITHPGIVHTAMRTHFDRVGAT